MGDLNLIDSLTNALRVGYQAVQRHKPRPVGKLEQSGLAPASRSLLHSGGTRELDQRYPNGGIRLSLVKPRSMKHGFLQGPPGCHRYSQVSPQPEVAGKTFHGGIAANIIGAKDCRRDDFHTGTALFVGTVGASGLAATPTWNHRNVLSGWGSGLFFLGDCQGRKSPGTVASASIV